MTSRVVGRGLVGGGGRRVNEQGGKPGTGLGPSSEKAVMFCDNGFGHVYTEQQKGEFCYKIPCRISSYESKYRCNPRARRGVYS